MRKLFIALMVALTLTLSLITGCTSTDSATNQTGQDAVQAEQQAAPQENEPIASEEQQTISYKNIDAAQAKQLIDTDKTLQLIDVREPGEFTSGHIKGAKLIPIGELSARMGEIDKSKPVLLYCASGARSAQAAEILTQNGYKTVYNLDQGIMSWTYEAVTGDK